MIESELDRRMVGQPSPLHRDQMSLFTLDAMRARSGGSFSSQDAVELLRENHQQCVAIDIGGTKMSIARVSFIDGLPVLSETSTHQTQNKGADFYPIMQQVAQDFPGNIALSIAGEVDDGGKTFGPLPNLPGLISALGNSNSFADIFYSRYTSANDAKCGLIAVATACQARGIKEPNVAFVIDGTGIGGATLDAQGQITQLEPGHVLLATPALNPYGYKQACDPASGRLDTCLERLGGYGSGSVAQWNSLHPDRRILNGRQLLQLAQAGERDAIDLVMLSTQIVTTISAGIVKASGFTPNETVIVYGGGASNIPMRVERMKESLQVHFNQAGPNIISAQSLTIDNPSLYGAAILAGLM